MMTRNNKPKDYVIPAEDIEKLNTMLKDFTAEVRIPDFQCRLFSLPEEHGDSGYGYRKYPAPEKLQKN